MRTAYAPRHMYPAHEIPMAEQMRGRTHAYRTADGDVVFSRSALHRRDTRCPACRRWMDR